MRSLFYCLLGSLPLALESPFAAVSLFFSLDPFSFTSSFSLALALSLSPDADWLGVADLDDFSLAFPKDARFRYPSGCCVF